MAEKISLTIAIADQPHVAALKNGSIPIEGVEPQFVTVKPQIAAFRRMVRDVEFDVCELAPTTYIIARANGAPFIGLPIFLMRRFHHSGLLLRPDSGIKKPKDLEGRKVGVRAYSVTTGVWTRGVFIDEYGLDSSKVTWVVDDEEHVRELQLPPNVVHAPEGKSLVGMMAAGEIEAGFEGNAGLGRAGAPTAGWDKAPAAAPLRYPDLFPDHEPIEADWFKRTGIYPAHGAVVVKEAILAEHPWVARSLFAAFARAKQDWLATLSAGKGDSDSDRKYLRLMKIVGDDPLPYGIAENIATITALEDTAFKQRLITRRIPIESAWVDPMRV